MPAKKTRTLAHDIVEDAPPTVRRGTKGRASDAEIIERARKQGAVRNKPTMKQRRTDKEMSRTRYLSTLKLDIISAECLRIHAIQRRVSQSALIADILNCWIGIATDYNQALFRELLPPHARAADAPERWQGYLASLGYAPAVRAKQNALPQAPATDPSPTSQPHNVPPPPAVAPETPTQEAPLSPPPDPASIQNRASEAEVEPLPRGDAHIRGFEPLPDDEIFKDPPSPADFPLPMSGRAAPRSALPQHMVRPPKHPITQPPAQRQADPTKGP